MDKLLALRTLVEVADTGGFSTAARRLGVATSSVMRLMDALEQSLNTTLFTRTTRKVLLTDAGVAYLEQVSKILMDLDAADRSVGGGEEEPVGALRVSIPITYSRLCLGNYLSDFMKAYPRVILDLTLSDSYVDLAVERIDIAVRAGKPNRDEHVVIKTLTENRRALVATPQYLKRFGTPDSPKALAGHECLQFARERGRQRWTFQKANDIQQIDADGPLITNSMDVLYEAVLGHHGVALLPEWLVQNDILAGRVKRLFEAWSITLPGDEAHLYAAYLSNRQHSRKVHTFIEYLEKHLKHASIK